MIRQYLVLLCILLILSGNVFAQDKDKDENEKEKKEKSDFQRRLFFGGYFWISFGTITQVELAPQVGYHISDRIAAGIGGKYMYYHNRFFFEDDISSHIFGGNAFASYVFVKDLSKILPFNINGQMLTHLEYEALNMPDNIKGRQSAGRFWSNSYFVGGGLRQKLGKKAFISLLLLYNLNHKIYLPYENPVFRISFGF